METNEIRQRIQKQRHYFESGATLPVEKRIETLKKLKKVIEANEEKIIDALKLDLGKSSTESYMCEVGLALSEISYMIRHTRSFAKEKRVRSPLAQYVSRSFVKPSPYGVVLIMSPWNYPFLLTIDPLADAIAAGNTVILKPSAYSVHTSAILERLIHEFFEPELITCISGGRKENQALLEQKFDYIFFTGSKSVGKVVMEKASHYLTPITLELGGKSPCIVDDSADIALAARRIAFGKYLNCGQTCVAPDYVLCHEKVHDAFVKALRKEIQKQYTEDPLRQNPNYGKIINEKHFHRLCALMDPEKVIYGGKADPSSLQIEPTILDHVTWSDPVMQEEIFGPLCPILTYSDLNQAIQTIQSHPDPLALYIFSSHKEHIERIKNHCSFGGGCINDTIIHLATTQMGFGGVGESGMGAYHGKVGFDTFSHKKSMVDKKTWLDLPIRYQPYTRLYDRMIRFFLK
ncbi:aldehyde dehydrogenase [Faecalicoccus acidiformans]|uniref:Aldehyde dehydrogenase n=1 Tax=Faecalicoccus acidiformans TaxID=915173 RepID=A0ABS2FN66_9FIRM|nr:aldehyde dehydrogenase [Faecalicoccus acidiformans]MBM6831214.1 aldehyde dehydrogenase [Faecalicoccus acidiformans]